MGTTAAPVAAPAPAAAPAAAPAPAASVPVSAPSTPAVEPQAPPAAPPPSGEGQQPPVAPAPAAAPGGEPKQDDFPGDVEAFLRAHNEWERKQQGIEEPKPAEGEQQPEQQPDAAKPPEGEQQPKPAEEGVTPESLSAFLQKDPALKAAIEANPEAKNALFAMARTNARLAPLGEIFPNVEAAKFAEQAAGTMVDIRSTFFEALDTGNIGNAFNRFAEEFVETDKDGKPVMEQIGVDERNQPIMAPVYGEDFQMLNDYIVDTYHSLEMEDLKKLFETNQFASEDERERADMALAAFTFIDDYKKNGLGVKPDLSKLDPQARAYYEQREKDLATREEKLNGAKREQSASERQTQRTNFEQAVARKVGSSVGKRLETMIADRAKQGVFIPSYVLEAKDPQTGIGLFAKKILDTLEERTYGRYDPASKKVIGGVAHIRNQAKQLARRPPSPDAEQARVEFGLRLIDEYLPNIFDIELRQIQRKAQADGERRTGGQPGAEQLTEKEPRGGSAPGGPKRVTPQDAMAQAYKEVDEQFPDLSPAERTEKALRVKDRILGM